ncbi:MAG: tetratricopeptide repeat protein [Planctomycetota bacterium]
MRYTTLTKFVSRPWAPAALLWVLIAAGLTLTPGPIAWAEPESAEPSLEPVPLSPTLARVLSSPVLNEDTRRTLELFHGQWEGFTPGSPRESAALALAQYRLADPALDHPDLPPRLLAQAALFRGEAESVLELLGGDDSADALLLRARALEDLGRLGEAVTLLTPLRARLQHETVADPAELVAGAQAIVLLARLEGRPSQDYQLAIGLLSKAHQELDPLYWPALVAQGELLMTKDNRAQAAEAFEEALALNPASGRAWAGLGRLSVESYNFEAAAEVARRLRAINPLHPLADELDLRSLLRQRDVASARRILGPALDALPQRRELLALAAAVQATAYDDKALAQALDNYDAVAGPGSPYALYTAGEHLSTDRQYVPAQALLRRAIERSPNWPAPRLELGLLLMQSGDLESARVELAHAARLDPFHHRVNNQLRLVENLLGIFQTIETEHFIIRYKPGIDEVLARDMPGPLEQMYDEITAIFQHEPAQKTQIDLLPDQSSFAVRITGMPHIWTIAAATGDVIAITPPRSGPDQADPYNWVNVLRHEYVHTVTLAQTKNRIPHWFTEACAVSAETIGRTYDTCQLLAYALSQDELFDYDQINWGFVRPKTPRDRPLAYAQADWMLEFIAHRWSHQAIVDLLDLYREGVSDTDALLEVTGYRSDEFMEAFREWARTQVEAWGLPLPYQGPKQWANFVRDEQLELLDLNALIERAERQPSPGAAADFARLIAERYLNAQDHSAARRWLRRYADLRPVDPWPHKQLVKLAFDLGEPETALGSLQLLEKSDNYTSVWSRQLAELHRAAGRLDAAQRAIERATYGEPYLADHREFAATVALQRGDYGTAVYQVEALEILEPDRAIHPTRLAAIHHKAGDADPAHAAAERALALNPNAPVQKFLKP